MTLRYWETGLISCRLYTCIFISKWVFLEFLLIVFGNLLTWCPAVLCTWQASYRENSPGTSHLQSKNKWDSLNKQRERKIIIKNKKTEEKICSGHCPVETNNIRTISLNLNASQSLETKTMNLNIPWVL